MNKNFDKHAYLKEKCGKAAEGVKLVCEASEAMLDCDFAVYTEDGVITVYSPLDSFFAEALDRYLTEGDFGRDASYVTDKVYYSDFGAVGDGIAEDVEALRAAHAYANVRNRHTVCGKSGDKYYIEKTGANPIEIATSCDFVGVEFIIDDRFIDESDEMKAERIAIGVFNVIPESKITYTKENDPLGIIAKINENGGIGTEDTEIALNLGYDALVALVNTEKSMYMRWDSTEKMGKGGPQQEVVVVRADNSIDPSTRPLFPYDGIDKLTICKCDTPQITLKGGRFTTIATRTDMHWNYVNRGMYIQRSNVVIDGMDHYVENQPIGAPYRKKLKNYERRIPVSSGGGPNYTGFINTVLAHNVLIMNTKLCGRVHYNNGSYDIGGTMTNKTVFKNCTQYNMYRVDGTVYNELDSYWGIHGTNYCKNIEFIDCELSRLDAHAGVYNVRISGCKLGKVNTVGGGTLLVEDTVIHIYKGIHLREDYASSWRGDIIFKNVVLDTKGAKDENVYLVMGSIHNVNYGFYSQIPNVTVDNVRYNKNSEVKNIYVYNIQSDESLHDASTPKSNKIIPAERVVIKNQSPEFKITDISSDGKADLYKELIYE